MRGVADRRGQAVPPSFGILSLERLNDELRLEREMYQDVSERKELLATVWCDTARLFRRLDKRGIVSFRANG